jgi:serine/threonine-protein kinase PknK
MADSHDPGMPRGATRRTPTTDASLVDGYEDLTEVGRGGFGIVYRASQVEFNRTVAVKVLTGVFDESARGRFERERRALGSLSGHPNIVTVYAAGFTSDGRPYIAMEFLPGGTLAERLSGRALSWPEAASIGIKIAGALQQAHELGVLHRDIKPENILMSAYGEPKLADFGIARLQGGYETRSGVITATYAHAAPELLDGKPPSPASDVYSLASTVYSLITGRAPFVSDADDDTLPAVIARIATQPPPNLRDQGVPDSLCETLERGLAKDPTHRTASAAEFGHELQAALRVAGHQPDDLVVLPAPVPPPDGPAAAPRRRFASGRWLVAAAAAVVIVAGGAAFALTRGSSSNSSGGTVPAMPTSLTGFRKSGASTTSTQRIFSGQPTFIDNFPWTMNGCADATTTTQWRSLVPDDVVQAGRTDQHGSTTLQTSQVRELTSGRSGLITADGCSEPVFFLKSSPVGDTLVDLAITTQRWTPAP